VLNTCGDITFVTDPNEEMPELATNEEWRGIMIRARNAHGLTQKQLGDKVGLSQVMISKLESGESSASTHVLRICRVLQIPEPVNFATDEQKEWWQLGHVLRARNPDQYEAALRLLRSMVDAVEQETAETQPPPQRPIRRR
jgi:transcriptional regulator with XRE-family HTH domain